MLYAKHLNMMTVLFIFAALSVLGTVFIVGAVIATRRPLPEFDPAEPICRPEVSARPGFAVQVGKVLLPAASH